MSLGPETRKLLDAGRASHAPSPEARARMRTALVKRIGPAAALAATTTAAGPAAGASAGASSVSALLLKLAVGGAVIGGLAVGGYEMAQPVVAPPPAHSIEAPLARSTPAHDPDMPHDDPVKPIASAPPPAAPAPPPTVPARAVVPTRIAERPAPPDREPPAAITAASEPAPVVSSAPPSVDALQGELALVRAAHDALREGRPAVALERMDEHRRTYPDGALSEERDALRALALCTLGRADAVAEARAFIAGHPASPFVARVRQACLR